MLTKKKSSTRTFVKGTVLVPVFAFLAIVISCNQEEVISEQSVEQTEWWHPILQKHNLKPVAFNNFERVFEMGEYNSINNGVCTLENGVAIIKVNDGSMDYMMIVASHIEHDIENNILKMGSGLAKGYYMDTDLAEPIITMSGDMEMTLTDVNDETKNSKVKNN